MSTCRKQILCLFTGFFLLAILISPAKPLAAPYYEGKVISIIVGLAAGTGYDQVARVLAKHLPKHIPGKPSVIVQNMPGADSIIAANHIYNVSKPDGLTIGLFNKNLSFPQLLKVEAVKFDLNKFSWIGSASIDFTILAIRSDLPYKTIQDVLNAKKLIFLGGSGPATPNTQLPLILKDFAGLNVQVVEYRSSAEIWLGIERKECDGLYIAYNSGRQYFARGLVRPILRTRIPKLGIYPGDIENLPVDEDFITDPMGKTLMTLYAAQNYAGKPFMAPPGTPANVMNIMRDAFAKTLKDPELQADAEKALMDLEYVSSEECLKHLNYILQQPAPVVKTISKYVKF